MLERDCWRFIQTRKREDAEYFKSLESVSNPQEKQRRGNTISEKPTSGRRNVGGSSKVNVRGRNVRSRPRASVSCAMAP
jgi:hypothetical protein